MSRGWREQCPYCGRGYFQQYEEPDGCPFCDGEERAAEAEAEQAAQDLADAIAEEELAEASSDCMGNCFSDADPGL